MAEFPTKFHAGMEHVVWHSPDGHTIPVVPITEQYPDEPLLVKDMRPDHYQIYAANVTDLAVECRWFLRCANDATHTQSHPILGDVPICDRCQGVYDANS